MTATSTISAEEFDQRFDDGEGLEEYLDMEHPVVRKGDVQRKVNFNMPIWLIDALDKKARHLGVNRQALVNIWLAERLAQEDGASSIA